VTETRGELAKRLIAEMMRECGYESREDYEASQEALPPHKREGYMERMMDYADHLNDLKQNR